MNLLNKFNKVSVDPSKSLLKGEDAEKCNEIEKDYLNAFQFHETHIEFFNINAEENRYLEFGGFREDVFDDVKKLSQSFVRDIVYHFSGKYKITISVEDIQAKTIRGYSYDRRARAGSDDTYADVGKYKVEMNSVLSLILDKLGGLSLEEKSESEMKDKFYQKFVKPYHKNWRDDKVEAVVELNKNRVTFERGIRVVVAYGVNQMEFGSREDVDLQVLFQGLSHFETRNTQTMNCFEKFKPYAKFDADFLLSDIEFDNLEKLGSVRFYKNHKMVLKFKTPEIAKMFFKEYCRNGELVGEL